MPKVFTGKVLIPAEHLDEYLEALAKAEKQREPFRAYLTALYGEFLEYLASTSALMPRPGDLDPREAGNSEGPAWTTVGQKSRVAMIPAGRR